MTLLVIWITTEFSNLLNLFNKLFLYFFTSSWICWTVYLNKHAPLKKTQVKTQPHPWYNEDIKDARLYRRACERVWRHTGLQCARIAYNEARNLVNNLIKRTKIQYYRHKLEYADNKDMFAIVNSLIKPKTESLPNFVSTEECCNKFADFFI